MGKYLRINKKTIIAIIIIIIILLILFWDSLFPTNDNNIPPPPPSTMHTDIFYTTGAIGNSVINFPVKLHIDSSFTDFWDRTNMNHNYFMFTDKNSNILNTEIEKWDYNNHDAVFYVCLSELSSTSVIKLLSGGDILGNLGNSDSVWNENYVLVCHMNDYDSTHIKDSKNGFLGTKKASNNPYEINNMQYFDGVDDYINFGDNDLFTLNQFTIDIIFNTEDTSKRAKLIQKAEVAPMEYLISIGTITNPGIGRLFFTYWYGDGYGNIYIREPYPTITTNTWHYVAGVCTGFTPGGSAIKLFLYLDNNLIGSQTVSTTNNPYNSNNPLVIGCGFGGDQTWGTNNDYIKDHYFKGYIDEVRISDIDRTSSWITYTDKSESETLGSWIHYPS